MKPFDVLKIGNLKAVRSKQIAYRGLSEIHPLLDSADTQPSLSPRVLIFSRACYTETRNWFPITNIVELKRFLLKKYPASAGYFYLIGAQKDARRSVQLFQLKCSIPEHTSVWVPETLLLGEHVKPLQVVEFQTPDGALFLARNANGELVSAKPSALLPNAKRFAWSAGLSPDVDTVSFSLEQTRSVMNARVNAFLIRNLWQLIFVKKQKIAFRLKPVVLTALIGIPIYFATTSLYLMTKAWQIESGVSANKEMVNSALNDQQQAQALLSSNQQMQAVLAQKNDQAKYWELLLLIEDEYNAEIEKVSWSQSSIEISGRTKADPTSILQVISQHPGIAQAEFSSPIRRRGAFANYRIRAEISAGGTQ